MLRLLRFESEAIRAEDGSTVRAYLLKVLDCFFEVAGGLLVIPDRTSAGKVGLSVVPSISSLFAAGSFLIALGLFRAPGGTFSVLDCSFAWTSLTRQFPDRRNRIRGSSALTLPISFGAASSILKKRPLISKSFLEKSNSDVHLTFSRYFSESMEAIKRRALN